MTAQFIIDMIQNLAILLNGLFLLKLARTFK